MQTGHKEAAFKAAFRRVTGFSLCSSFYLLNVTDKTEMFKCKSMVNTKKEKAKRKRLTFSPACEIV